MTVAAHAGARCLWTTNCGKASGQGCCAARIETGQCIERRHWCNKPFRGHGAYACGRSWHSTDSGKRIHVFLILSSQPCSLQRSQVALLNNGAVLDVQNKAGLTAVIHAALAGKAPIISLLCQRGAELNVRDQAGETALHKACANDSPACVQGLVNAGADTRQLNYDGRSPLHACVANKTERCAMIILDAAAYNGWIRALVVARDCHGQTALDMATRIANKPLAILLRKTVAAMIVQDNFRGYLGRLLKARTECAVKIQRVYRGRSTRQFYKQHSRARDIRLNYAARTIQRRYRKWAMSRYRRETFGATARIQTDFATDVVLAEAKELNAAEGRAEAARAQRARNLGRQERQQVGIASVLNP